MIESMENTQATNTNVLPEKSDWLIAAIFFVVAGFLAPWAVAVVALNLYFAGGSEYLSQAGLGGGSLGLILTCISIYLGVLLVAKVIKKYFVIRAPKRVALIAAGYFVFILGPWYSYEYLADVQDLGLEGAMPMLAFFRFLALAIFAYTLYSSIRKHLVASV